MTFVLVRMEGSLRALNTWAPNCMLPGGTALHISISTVAIGMRKGISENGS